MIGGGQGGTLTIGLVGYYDTPRPEDAQGAGYGAQANLTVAGGMNVSYGYSDQPGSMGRHSQNWSVALSGGAQLGASYLQSYTLPPLNFDFDR